MRSRTCGWRSPPAARSWALRSRAQAEAEADRRGAEDADGEQVLHVGEDAVGEQVLPFVGDEQGIAEDAAGEQVLGAVTPRVTERLPVVQGIAEDADGEQILRVGEDADGDQAPHVGDEQRAAEDAVGEQVLEAVVIVADAGVLQVGSIAAVGVDIGEAQESGQLGDALEPFQLGEVLHVDQPFFCVNDVGGGPPGRRPPNPYLRKRAFPTPS